MILRQFISYALVCQMNNFIIYNTNLQTGYECALGAEKTKMVNLHATITLVKIDHINGIILTHTAPPTPSQKHTQFLSAGEGVVHPPLPTLMSLEEEAEELLLLPSCKMY